MGARGWCQGGGDGEGPLRQAQGERIRGARLRWRRESEGGLWLGCPGPLWIRLSNDELGGRNEAGGCADRRVLGRWWVPLRRDGRFAKRPYGGGVGKRRGLVVAGPRSCPAPLDSCLRRNDDGGGGNDAGGTCGNDAVGGLRAGECWWWRSGGSRFGGTGDSRIAPTAGVWGELGRRGLLVVGGPSTGSGRTDAGAGRVLP